METQTRTPGAGLHRWLANPVVVRDLRAQMRSVKTFAYIGLYLLLLGVLSVAGYAVSVNLAPTGLFGNENEWSIVDAQANLQQFHYFIFGTLALMVTLIAPALTSASIVGERQRQSFDLLITTPLTANQILVGKLLSSVAFLGFLLLLSLPASVLCIVLGGATLWEVLRIYLLLAVDGIVLSAIGLYFSCAVRMPSLATVWTALAVAGFVGGVMYVSTVMTQLVATGQGTIGATEDPIQALFWLSPIAAIQPMNASVDAVGWLLRLATFLGVATLAVRILLSAATYRLGNFGSGSAVSLRKQALVLVGVVAAFLFHTLAKAGNYLMTTGGNEAWLKIYVFLLLFAFIVALPFLPGLFVPAAPEDAPPGQTPESASVAGSGWFRLRRMFYPEHAGALPWYGAFVLIIAGAMWVGVAPYPRLWGLLAPLTVVGAGYLLGLGTLVWSLARLTGSILPELSPARGLAFALTVAVLGLPTLFLAFQSVEWQTNPLAALWLFSPLLYTEPGQVIESLFRQSVLAVSLATLFFLLGERLRSVVQARFSPTRGVS